METTLDFNVLDTISKIFDKSENSKFEKTLRTKLKPELQLLAKFFNTNEMQAFFLSLVFALNYKNTNSVDFSDICKCMDINPMKLLKHIEDFNYLVENDYLVKEQSRFNFDVAYADNEYTVSKQISKAIIDNVKIETIGQKKYDSVIDVLEEIYLLTEQFSEEKINQRVLFKKISRLVNNNKHIEFLKDIKRLNLNKNTEIIYFLLIWEILTGSETVDIEQTVDRFIKSPRYKIRFIQDFNNNKKNKLIQFDLIEIEEDDFINNSKMKLSEKSLNILKKEGLTIFKNIEKKKKNNVVYTSEIANIKMYYNSSEQKQIAMLNNALKPKKYKELQTRLKGKNLPSGITSLFYGYPGTGKTESVLQIAKQTGRDIMKVDISQTKSKWFGDSEKLIKGIFTNYYKFKRESKKTPILLFNEADAVISKRKDSSSSNVAQTENAIQNIILEELETFDGIFIATTNLASNLDNAFERRFLFKIEFHKPNTDIKTKIWKSKLKNLKLAECKVLAKQFNFSGGQINNIVRKVEMSEVIDGQKKSLETIREFCEEEIISKHNKNKIGFTN